MEANKVNLSVAISHAKVQKEEEDQREVDRLADQHEQERLAREAAGEDTTELPPVDQPPHTTDAVSKG